MLLDARHAALEYLPHLVPSFSRDGLWIYFSSTRTGTYQVWKVPVSGGEAVQVTRDGGWAALESPDGATLYYTAAAVVGASLPLWRIPTAGGTPTRVLEAVINSSFDVLEQGIFYGSEEGGDLRILFHDFSLRKQTVVSRGLGRGAMFGGFTVAPDGSTIPYAKQDAAVDDLMLVDGFR